MWLLVMHTDAMVIVAVLLPSVVIWYPLSSIVDSAYARLSAYEIKSQWQILRWAISRGRLWESLRIHLLLSLTHGRYKRRLTPNISCVLWMIMFPHWIVDYEKGIVSRERECSVGARKLPIDNTRDAGRCIGIDDQNILGVKVARRRRFPDDLCEEQQPTKKSTNLNFGPW